MERNVFWLDERSGNFPGAHECRGGLYEAETDGASTAVIEVYLDDVLLGNNDADEHLRLVGEFWRTCEKCNTRVKSQKCEFV